MDSPTPMSPTKRKRGQEATSLNIPQFSFDFHKALGPDDGNSSPRSKVAHRFRGLNLDNTQQEGGQRDDDNAVKGISHDVFNNGSSVEKTTNTRKRQRADGTVNEVPSPVPVGVTDSDGRTIPQPEVAQELHPPGQGSIERAYPSINRLSESESRSPSRPRKRSGSPPLRRRRPLMYDPSASDDDDDSNPGDEMEIVDPIRAALTWHEHEITVYDPDDEDDDGTGINGVGFKPTPALAHARAMKRKQQMAEYRKREESDARARRSERRRRGGGGGQESGGSRERDGKATMAVGPDNDGDDAEPPARKVRFSETDGHSNAITFG